MSATIPPDPPSDLPSTLGRARGPRGGSRRRCTRRCAATPRPASPRASPWWTGSSGFDDTVLPQLENALLAGHDIILLGERGQAKTRLIRSLVGLLDEWLPVVAGSEINDDPFHPVSRLARDLVAETGDDHPAGVGPPRDLRYGGEAGHPRHLDRRPDRRGRPHQDRRGPLPVRRADPALRPGAPVEPGHLRHQRAARPRRAHPGRPAQRARGARRADPRLTASGCRSTSCWWPRPTPRTTPTGAGSSRR